MKECLQTNIMVSHLQIISSVQETNQIQIESISFISISNDETFYDLGGGGYGFS